jgi:hypothetical protein
LQEQCKINDDQLFFVNFNALRPLFKKCHEPGCDSQVQDSDVNFVVKGAGLKISAVCSEHHLTRWESAEFINDVSLKLIWIGNYENACDYFTDRLSVVDPDPKLFAS